MCRIAGSKAQLPEEKKNMVAEGLHNFDPKA
jgi:hypothetical protein